MISFQDVNKHYGHFHVLKNINLHIKKGEVVVIIAPSGSGKSTLLRCINQLETVDGGALTVNGVSIHDKKTDINKVAAISAWCSSIFICTRTKPFCKTSCSHRSKYLSNQKKKQKKRPYSI